MVVLATREVKFNLFGGRTKADGGDVAGGQGERIERIKRDVPGVAIPGVRRLAFLSRLSRR